MRTINIAAVSADTSAFSWRKSSRSAANGNCVEVTQVPGHRVAVRDSKNRAGAPMVLAANDWSVFLERIKNGAAGG
jgi:Domain of unknown function (DUF397)